VGLDRTRAAEIGPYRLLVVVAGVSDDQVWPAASAGLTSAAAPGGASH
jgi:hypothetical protein